MAIGETNAFSIAQDSGDASPDRVPSADAHGAIRGDTGRPARLGDRPRTVPDRARIDVVDDMIAAARSAAHHDRNIVRTITSTPAPETTRLWIRVRDLRHPKRCGRTFVPEADPLALGGQYGVRFSRTTFGTTTTPR
ncbi:hypothetical protein GCM10012275_10500 [Longimycelium tulufanense]|uniref:Uncharacterized protein n=1 Tax=Longimycelium tulufanense TaxID=907463 RepID=A0A8J3C8M6_9PSEU|nr:hypothetical protein GCM10012275_10500 [Longimycelium tulufanense]